ncbi:hypothetical protein ABZ639_00690 [Saccharomonospora sp. NPDC006951]
MGPDSNSAATDSGPKRRRGLVPVIAAAAAIVLAGVAVFVVGSGDAPDELDASGSVEPSPPRVESFDEPPDGGELKLVDSGLSIYEVEGLPDALSYGVVVENTSDAYVAEFPAVSVAVLDGNGEVVAAGDELALRHDLTVVMPGERIGMGDAFNVGNLGLDPASVELDVTIGDARWRPVEDSGHAAVVAGAVTVGDVDDSWVELTFEVTSRYSGVLASAQAYAIFRDSEGVIVGGAPPMGGQRLSPGKSEGTLEVRDRLPETADETKTEVYVLPY